MTDTLLAPWIEAIDEFPITGTTSEKLCAAARHAMLAPSSHNSQPWIFRVKGATLDLYADRSRGQPVVDPRDRELTIACGAALYIIRITLAHFGSDSGVKLLPDPRDPDLLARVTLEGPVEAPARTHQLYDAVHRRRTNRRPFKRQEIPAQVLARGIAAVEAHGGRLERILDSTGKAAIAHLISDADRIQMADAAFRQELAQWMHSNRSERRDGMPGSALGMGDLASRLGPTVVRHFDLGGGLARRDRELATGAPALGVLWTRRDTPRDWLRAGQALAALLLNLQADSVSASFLNQPVQVAALRGELRSLIDCPGSPQLVLRLGYAAEVPATPRREPDEVIIDLSKR
jgi:nitroreductase